MLIMDNDSLLRENEDLKNQLQNAYDEIDAY